MALLLVSVGASTLALRRSAGHGVPGRCPSRTPHPAQRFHSGAAAVAGHRGCPAIQGVAQRRGPGIGADRAGGLRSAPGPGARAPMSRRRRASAVEGRRRPRSPPRCVGQDGAMTEPRGLRVGYKASAEQFAPGELAGYAVRAEELGLDSVTISDHFQPWRLEGGHAPNSLAWMSWVLAAHRAGAGRHLGDDADLPLQPGRGGADLRDDGLPGTRAGSCSAWAPVRRSTRWPSGRSAEGEWPEFKERFGRLREAVRADARAVDRRTG